MASLLYDVLSSFEAGMNSGVEPLLLQKNQLANLTNGTVRGGYVTHRPPKVQRTIVYPDDEGVTQAVVEGGHFQGAGTYRYDDGTSQLVAQISGRLFAFTATGDSFVCSEISIAGDYNNADTAQAWMWQSEKWLIIGDGNPEKLPIFYDGVSCRRSYGPSRDLATVTALGAANVPPIGEIISVTLDANWTEPFNVPVIFNGEYYEPTESGTTTPTYTAQLYNPRVFTSQTVNDESVIIIDANRIGIIETSNLVATNILELTFDVPHGLGIGSSITVQRLDGVFFNTTPIEIVSDVAIKINRTPPFTTPGGLTNVAWGSVCYLTGSTLPITQVGVVDGTTNIAIGATATITLDALYSGANNQSVWIGNLHFLISQGVALPPSTTLKLINLTDTAGVAYPVAPLDILSVPELPSCRMGAYGQQRNWICKPDGISFFGGDIVGGASGTTAHNYRDAVLKTTENDFLDGRGAFQLPGSGDIITSMDFMALLDQTLGQGPLMISTASGIFACQVPTDTSDWASLTTPILPEVFIGLGPTGFNSNVIVNSDLFFRSTEGIGTLKMARRDFSDWGNAPISREVESILKNTAQRLLPHGTGVLFDNRLLLAVQPYSNPSSSIVHSGCVALNLDAISNVRGKLPPCWDGHWNDWNILQFVSGNFSNTLRAFFFGVDAAGHIVLNEILKTDAAYFDDVSTAIPWSGESPILFNRDIKPPHEVVQLANGELNIRDIRGTPTITVEYRPDFYPCWTTWRTFTLSADDTNNPGYRCPVTLGEPSAAECESANNRPFRNGMFFQVRISVTGGSCKIMGMRFAAARIPEADFGNPICNETVVTQNIECDLVAP